MKRVIALLTTLLVFSMLFTGMTFATAVDFIGQPPNEQGIVEFADCFHTYIESPAGAPFDRWNPAAGKMACVQTMVVRCTKCGTYYYSDKVLFYYN